MTDTRLSTIVVILCIIMMPLGQMGIDIYTPSMPSMVQAFSVDPVAIKFTVTLFTLGLSVALLLTGPFIDRFGRYPFLLLGLTLYVLSALLSGLTLQLPVLYAARVLQGLGAGMTITTARAAISDCFDGEDLARVMANMAIVWSMTPILAPYLGGYIEHYVGWSGNFIFMSAYCSLILLSSVLFLRETLPTSERHSIHVRVILNNFRRILTHRELIGYIIPMCIVYAYIILFNVVAPFILQNKLGMTPVEFGETILLVAATQLVANIINKKCLPYVMRRTLILSALLFSIAVTAIQLVLALAGYFNFYVLLIPVALNFGAVGFIYANSVGNAMALFRDIAGSASSLLGFLPMATCAVATIVATHLPHNSITQFALLVLVCYCLAAVVFYWLVYRSITPES